MRVKDVNWLKFGDVTVTATHVDRKSFMYRTLLLKVVIHHVLKDKDIFKHRVQNDN